MADTFQIADRPIGPEYSPYIIAELSGNHRGDLTNALALVDAAAASGADAVKLQTYTADTFTSITGRSFALCSTQNGNRSFRTLRKSFLF